MLNLTVRTVWRNSAQPTDVDEKLTGAKAADGQPTKARSVMSHDPAPALQFPSIRKLELDELIDQLVERAQEVK